MKISVQTRALAALLTVLCVLTLAACGNTPAATDAAVTGGETEAEVTLSAEATEGEFAYVTDGKTAIITAYTGEDAAVTIPETLGGEPVSAIGEGAFKEKTALTEITLPDTLTEIGTFAFWGCAALQTVTLPDALTKIGDAAFMNCTSLKSVSFPASLTSIGISAFCSTGITSVTIPEKVTSLPTEVFSDCPALTSVILPATVTDIDPDAFYDSDNIVITCARGSAAENFAVEYEIPHTAF